MFVLAFASPLAVSPEEIDTLLLRFSGRDTERPRLPLPPPLPPLFCSWGLGSIFGDAGCALLFGCPLGFGLGVTGPITFAFSAGMASEHADLVCPVTAGRANTP